MVDKARFNAEEFVQVLQQLLSSFDSPVVLHEPQFSGNEWQYVKECLDTGWVSSVGKFVDRFEAELAQFTGAKYAIATANGTAALHICYLLAGVKPDDEVLVPTMTFVATTNAISYCGAKPHFVDAEENQLGIDPSLLENYLKDISQVENNVCFNRQTGKIIRALCVMHTLGHPVDLDPIEEICQRYHLTLIEDAAEALGSYYKGTHVGHRGLAGSLSFNGNKIITTGGGGAILTNHDAMAKQAKHLTTTAKLPHQWCFEHDRVGFNYRLPNINAALGCAQLEQISAFLQAKRKLADDYEKTLAKVDGVRIIKAPAYAQSNYWLNAVLLDKSIANKRDATLSLLHKNQMYVRPLWNLQHTLPMYQDCQSMPLSLAESLAERLIKLPSSPKLSQR